MGFKSQEPGNPDEFETVDFIVKQLLYVNYNPSSMSILHMTKLDI